MYLGVDFFNEIFPGTGNNIRKCRVRNEKNHTNMNEYQIILSSISFLFLLVYDKRVRSVANYVSRLIWLGFYGNGLFPSEYVPRCPYA